MTRFPRLTPDQLHTATRLVNTGNDPQFASAGGVKDLGTLGIRHVILLVKENRTYDQIFGDMKQGNSDPRFLM